MARLRCYLCDSRGGVKMASGIWHGVRTPSLSLSDLSLSRMHTYVVQVGWVASRQWSLRWIRLGPAPPYAAKQSTAPLHNHSLSAFGPFPILSVRLSGLSVCLSAPCVIA